MILSESNYTKGTNSNLAAATASPIKDSTAIKIQSNPPAKIDEVALTQESTFFKTKRQRNIQYICKIVQFLNIFIEPNKVSTVQDESVEEPSLDTSTYLKSLLEFTSPAPHSKSFNPGAKRTSIPG